MYCDNCGEKLKSDDQFCTNCGENIYQEKTDVEEQSNKERFVKNRKKKNIILAIVALVVFIIVIIAVSYINYSNKYKDKNAQNQQSSGTINNTKAVVQIACDNEYSGSGTVLSDDGVIITNNHVLEGATYCLVTIPDENTGEISEMYEAQPTFIPKLSNLYDIAMLVITGAYVDEKGTSWGTYPQTFVYFQKPSTCTDRPSKLGDSIKIFGYPSTSHNYNLTITDGIISNFDTGYILTSAKVDSGNSGGLAVDQEGCFVGIPSAVLQGDYQNLGVIIPANIVSEFLAESSDITPSFESDNVTSSSNKRQGNITSPSIDLDPKIDCVGPDGKHMSITQKECDDFNNAWKPRATISPQNTNQNTPCGANQYYSYGSCYCNDGYSKNYSTGLCDPCPVNSTGSYGVCTCNNGYSKNYSTGLCEPCPANSTGSYGSCLCNSGYTKDYSTGQCIKN